MKSNLTPFQQTILKRVKGGAQVPFFPEDTEGALDLLALLSEGEGRTVFFFDAEQLIDQIDELVRRNLVERIGADAYQMSSDHCWLRQPVLVEVEPAVKQP
jgi:hypothetical protein